MTRVEHPEGWPSVTTVLKDYAMGWLKFFYLKYGSVQAAEIYSRGRANVGSRCHLALEALLKKSAKETVTGLVESDERVAVEQLANVLGQLDVELVASERHVQSTAHKYHGSLDGLIRINNPSMLPTEDFMGTPLTVEPGVLAIMDLKTKENDKPLTDSEMRKHAMQMAAYGKAVEEEDGEFPSLGLIIQLDIPTARVRLHAAYPLERFVKPFLLQREQFDYINGKGEWESKRKRKKRV